MNHALAAYAINRWGTAEQKKKYLPALTSAKTLGAFAVYEHGATPGVGADALMATRQAEGWVLNGTKAYVRNAGKADVYVVLACTDPAAGAKALTAFIVSAKAIGLKVGEPAETMGLEGLPRGRPRIRQRDRARDGNARPAKSGCGRELITKTLAINSLAEAAQTVGIGEAAVEHAAAYSKTRVQFGRPISALQAIQTLLAETATDCYLARLGVHDAAQMLENGEPFQLEVEIVKPILGRFSSKMLVSISLQVEGGFGYSEFMPLPRLFRDIAGTTLLEAPADLPEKTIAAALLA